MSSSQTLSAGDWVEVRSKDEILATLDKNGRLEGLPFMPGMFLYCGRRFRVYKRAHKTCDTVHQTGGLRMPNAVHLEGIRCKGQEYGGCQAACLVFWKVAWLRQVDGPEHQQESADRKKAQAGTNPLSTAGCTEEDVLAGTRVPDQPATDELRYVCQATEMPRATRPLAWWDVSQYVEDYTSGNVTLGRLFRGFVYSSYYNLSRSGLGVGAIMRWLYDRFQALWGGLPYPRRDGKIPLGKATPSCALNLQPGELVRVKSYEEILATLNTENRNRGMLFDAEAVPYCDGTYRVARRINTIIDENTGKLKKMKVESVVLEGVYCKSRYSDRRMFCPRSIDTWWREIWLERIPSDAESDNSRS